jgi:hypothetical protein
LGSTLPSDERVAEFFKKLDAKKKGIKDKMASKYEECADDSFP